MRRVLLALVLGLASLPGSAEEGLRVVYDTTQTTLTASDDRSPGEKVTRETVTAVLLPSALVLHAGEQESVYDFAVRQVTVLDHAKQVSTVYSLYAVPAFIEEEIVNRQALYRVARQLGLSKDVDMIDAESQLGMTAHPPTRLKLVEKARDDARVFLLNGREGTLLTASGTIVPEPLRRSLAHLLIYHGAFHPRVRERVLADGRLPQRLEFRWREIGGRNTVVWELRDAAAGSADIQALLSRYPRRSMETEGLPQLAWRVTQGEFGPAPLPARYVERAERLLGEGRSLEALLVALEGSYATVTQDDAFMKKVWEASAADPRASAIRRVTQIELQHGDPREALTLLDGIDPSGLEGAPSIHIMRAMQRIRAGQGDHALLDFAKALEINPFMVGPWMDAGRLFHDSYRTASAWTCWDAVRAFAPGHPELKAVEEREASLVREHPEYF